MREIKVSGTPEKEVSGTLEKSSVNAKKTGDPGLPVLENRLGHGNI
jgi:hypothetical protein